MKEDPSKREKEHASNESRVCECGRDAVEKVVGPRSANHGLRYLCCDRFVLFGKRKNSCRFFEWIDQPRVSKEQKKEAQALLHKEKGAALVNEALLQPAVRTRSAVRDLEKQCETIEGLYVNKENFELEIRVSKDDPPWTQVHKDVRNAMMDIPVTSQQGVVACDGAHVVMEIESDVAQITYNGWVFLAKHPQSLSTSLFQPKTGICEVNAISQQRNADVEDVKGVNLRVGDTLRGADTSISEVPEDKDASQESKQSLRSASELLETPSCHCSRAAVLKTVNSKGPNKGLRFWVCSNSQPFYMKKKKSKLNADEESCKFFRWIDEPRVPREQKKETQALFQKEKVAASGKRALPQPAISIQNTLRDLEKRCKTTEVSHLNKENFKLETSFSHGDLAHTQAYKDVGNVIMNTPSASLVIRDGADVTMKNESVAAQMKGADTSISEVAKDKDTNLKGMQSLENASQYLETPTCLCLRVAVLKTVKSKGPNKGLRFWVCATSQPFYAKRKSKLDVGKESCKFFRWVDTPFEKSDAERNQEKQRRKDTQKRKELSLLS